MFLFDFKLARNIRFRLDKYEADSIYVEECCNKDIKKHIYVPNIYTYYNYLGRNLLRRSYYRFGLLDIFYQIILNYLKLLNEKNHNYIFLSSI